MNQSRNLNPPPSTGLPEGVTQADIDRHLIRKSSLKEAAIATLPGPLREAFAGETPTIHSFTIRPLTVGMLALLTRINSPLLDVAKVLRLNHEKPQEELQAVLQTIPPPDPEAMTETVFVFTTPAAEVRQLLARGRDAFREAALTKVGDKLSPAQMADLETACGAQFFLGFATVVEFEPLREDLPQNFPSPPAAAPAMASAGGSTSSAV